MGTRRAAPLLTAYIRRQPGGRLRVGISVGRRMGSAVVRNRIRRRVREALRRVGHLAKEGADIVLSPRRAVAEAPFEELVKNLQNILLEAGLASPSSITSEEAG